MKFLKRFNVANHADKCGFIGKVLGFVVVILTIFVDDGMVTSVSLDAILLYKPSSITLVEITPFFMERKRWRYAEIHCLHFK